jgi:predicted small secreted protein
MSMKKRICWIIIMVAVAFLASSCTTSTSVGGASLETGYDIDSSHAIVTTSNTFPAGDEFYYSFYNGSKFGSNVVTLKLIDSESNEVLLEYDYDVDPNWDIMADTTWFNEPGKYKIVILIDGKTRATQEVIIQ